MRTLASRAAVAVAASLVLAAGAGAAGAAPAAPRAIEDDYPGALAQARKLGVPLVVDVWAPW